ncbi:hypothetical protein Maq22A_c10465 [Methylobacterium aquaticum]|uniref:Uncharacterized protein n=1 Tax=Methylobacterium aquaticum TaxID=270351 RepID=A0A0C6EYQ8_9HYPH|nr:hypothetical protein Maq22A_c10465 [Methylobacterium aquaticum]
MPEERALAIDLRGDDDRAPRRTQRRTRRAPDETGERTRYYAASIQGGTRPRSPLHRVPARYA